ncbi:MAG: tRNA lysidine(34) synthetase TilS [Planctomycetota bacterium]|nr:tRNA lysidine(34) synthetase TilS [Planctomycetota bacterium]
MFSFALLDEVPAPPAEEVLLQVDGEPVTWGGWSLSARREAWGGPCSDPLEEWVDEYSIGDGLLVRGRLPGDRVWPLGAPGSKKLKEFLRESGVSSPGRDGVPLVVSGEKIVWVVGQRLCQPFSISSAESRAVRLQAERIEEPA